MKKLTREQYQELEAQVERITDEPKDEGVKPKGQNLTIDKTNTRRES